MSEQWRWISDYELENYHWQASGPEVVNIKQIGHLVGPMPFTADEVSSLGFRIYEMILMQLAYRPDQPLMIEVRAGVQVDSGPWDDPDPSPWRGDNTPRGGA